MIDLNYRKQDQPQKIEPEEIVIAIIAMAIWATIAILFGRAL